MSITKINIENFKCFYGKFSLNLGDGVNILVGDNESGKSTVLQAINLALTGMIDGRSILSEISPYIFNVRAIDEFLQNLSSGTTPCLPPSVGVEVFFGENEFPNLEGEGNSEGKGVAGISLTIEFSDDYRPEYGELLKAKQISSLPIEFYRVNWRSFARSAITARSVPVKVAMIDSTAPRYQNGSDIYISRIVQAELDDAERVAISREYREMRDCFGCSESIKAINTRLKEKSAVNDRDIRIDVDLSPQKAWHTSLAVFMDKVPFHHIGKGEQCMLKTHLALGHRKTKDADVILMEEPENHLSHTKLNILMQRIAVGTEDKQVIVSTHSSFVANKLGLDRIIFLNKSNVSSFKDLPNDTYKFFKKAPGYQTLRLLLCRKAVLVEGPSDELIFQKAYLTQNNGRLPIEDGVDVLSTGLAFKRFLEIAKLINHETAVITDNDGNYNNNIIKKYSDFDGFNNIKIFADQRQHLRTLEYQFFDTNSENIENLRNLLSLEKSKFPNDNDVIDFMLKNKTEWAISVFDSDISFEYPPYIIDAVRWCDE